MGLEGRERDDDEEEEKQKIQNKLRPLSDRPKLYCVTNTDWQRSPRGWFHGGEWGNGGIGGGINTRHRSMGDWPSRVSCPRMRHSQFQNEASNAGFFQ